MDSNNPLQAPGTIDGDELLDDLPPAVRAVMAQRLGAADPVRLLALSDRKILSTVEADKRVDLGALSCLRRWLAQQRLAQAGQAMTPIEAKARADDMLMLARCDLASRMRQAIREARLSPDEVAKRSGTSRETVTALMAGGVPATLETALRLAAVLGLRMACTTDTGGNQP